MEAKLVKALDKIEILIQHNQGDCSHDFDYQFNRDYGKKYSQLDPIVQSIRELLDRGTLIQFKRSKA